MENELISKLEKSIEQIKEKNARIYFFIQETKGNAKASIRYMYDFALTLHKNGYNTIMLTEKPDYTPIESWLPGDYNQIPHQPIEGGTLAIAPEDLLFLPEIFGFVMEQVKNLPCAKIVIAQAYDHILETLQPGASWPEYGFLKCITTSDSLKTQIMKTMRGVHYDVIEPLISESFVEQVVPPKPIISVHTREQRDGINLIKEFYLRFPQYRWVTFRDLRGLSENEFASALKESFVSIWIDQTSGFGTFPLESMKCNVPVIGKIPKNEPDWLGENGMWVGDESKIIEVLGTYVLAWLEGVELKDEVKQKMKDTLLPYSTEITKSNIITIFDSFKNKRIEAIEKALNKIKQEETV